MKLIEVRERPVPLNPLTKLVIELTPIEVEYINRHASFQTNDWTISGSSTAHDLIKLIRKVELQ